MIFKARFHSQMCHLHHHHIKVHAAGYFSSLTTHGASLKSQTICLFLFFVFLTLALLLDSSHIAGQLINYFWINDFLNRLHTMNGKRKDALILETVIERKTIHDYVKFWCISRFRKPKLIAPCSVSTNSHVISLIK